MANAIALELGGRIVLEDDSGVILTELQPGQIVGNLAPYTTYKVEVGWGQSWAGSGVFIFGTSTFGGSDTLGSSFSTNFNVPYGDLTDRVRQVSFQRGRDDLLSTMQSGSCTIDLKDPDGLLNVRNPSSPLNGVLYTGVPVRVSAMTSGGILVPIYYGFIQTLTSNPGGRYGTAQISAVDFFDRMAREKPNLGSLSGQSTGSLIANLLTAMGWTDPALRDLATGDALPSPYTRADGTNGVISLVEEAMVTERGYFYIAGSGAVTYLSRFQTVQTNSLATLDRTMTDAPSTLDASRVVNRWTVSRTDMAGNPIGVPQVAAVPTTDRSYLRYHYIDDSISTPLLANDNAALGLAQYLLAITKNPTGVGWQVPINPSDPATLDQLLLRDLGDRVTLTVDPISWPAYTTDFTIQRIQTTIQTDPGSPRHLTTWGLAEIPIANPFTFGSSTFGGTDVLVY